MGLVLYIAISCDFFRDFIGGFILIKMVLFIGGEGLWYYFVKENFLKNEVIKVKGKKKKDNVFFWNGERRKGKSKE